MNRGYRVILIDEHEASVQEYRVSTRVLVGLLLGLFGSLVVVLGAGLGVAFGAHALARSAHKSPASPQSLNPGLARPASAYLVSSKVVKKNAPGPCAEGMVLVAGEYCPQARHRCLRFTDPDGSSLHSQRCAEYESPARCLNPVREKLRYCIDQDEFVAEGEQLPRSNVTVADARAACEEVGKRLCTQREWTFACEGEQMSPYPYGFKRESERCNTDLGDLVTAEGTLKDLRRSAESLPGCVSPFGVRNLTGNVEEFVAADSQGSLVVRKGAYWQPGANTCRASQTHPDVGYSGIELGFRCCNGVAPGAPSED